MAKKATAKSDDGGKKTNKKDKGSEGRQLQRASGGTSGSNSSASGTDAVDALIKLLQSPLVIDLLAVGATAALAAITENRSSRTQGAVTSSKKTLKAAGKAAAAAVGRRIATEIDEIRDVSRRAGDERKAKTGAAA